MKYEAPYIEVVKFEFKNNILRASFPTEGDIGGGDYEEPTDPPTEIPDDFWD